MFAAATPTPPSHLSPAHPIYRSLAIALIREGPFKHARWVLVWYLFIPCPSPLAITISISRFKGVNVRTAVLFPWIVLPRPPNQQHCKRPSFGPFQREVCSAVIIIEKFTGTLYHELPPAAEGVSCTSEWYRCAHTAAPTRC